VLSQFSDSLNRATLSDYLDAPGYYPAGRLDFDSEGLLLLTDSGALQARIAEPARKMLKHYWVQVEGIPDISKLAALLRGVALKDGVASARSVQCIPAPAALWLRDRSLPAHREENSSWLDLQVDSGRNRMVRRMLAHIGHPVLRLIRHRIGDWSLDTLKPGEHIFRSVHLPKQSTNGVRAARPQRTKAARRKDGKRKPV
jgi:23S rRNA pseudouridine2457 synthase